ncbi:MAG: M56 family metallopeptidase [Planctomycetota bacterium]
MLETVLNLIPSTLFVSAMASFLLVGVAATMLVALRSASAATRHAIILYAMVGMLAAPLCGLLLPKWEILPSWGVASIEDATTSASSVLPTSTSAIRPTSSLQPNSSTQQPGELPENPESNDSPEVAQNSGVSSVVTAAPTATAAKNSTESGPASSSWQLPSMDPANWILLAWALGTILCMLRLFGSFLALGRLRRTSTQLGKFVAGSFEANHDHDQACKLLAARIARIFSDLPQSSSQNRNTALLRSEHHEIPLVWGLWNHKIALPISATSWDDSKLRSVLLHELGHIQRQDTITMLLAQITCAMYWFNPLLWRLCQRMQMERECACDDLVLGRGVAASSYAEHLLQIAESFQQSRNRPICGLAMATRSDLDSRLEAVLCPNRNRGRASKFTTLASLGIILLVALPTAMMGSSNAAENPISRPILGTSQGPNPQEDDDRDNQHQQASGNKTQGDLHWGDPVNGLQAAIMLRQKEDFDVELYIVVKNVSDKTIHIQDTKATHEHTIRMHLDGKIAQALHTDSPNFGDVSLAAGKTVELVAFQQSSLSSDQQPIGTVIAQSLLLNPRLSCSATLEIQGEAADSWTGELKTPTVKRQQAVVGEIPTLGESLDPGIDTYLSWGETNNGLQCALAIQQDSGQEPNLVLIVKNASEQRIRFLDKNPKGQRYINIFQDDLFQSRYRFDVPTELDVYLQPDKSTIFEFASAHPDLAAKAHLLAKAMLQKPDMVLTVELNNLTSPIASWTGSLKTGKTTSQSGQLLQMPKDDSSKELYRQWLALQRLDGMIPGGALFTLRDATANFVKGNPTDSRSPKLKEFLTEIDVTKDWSKPEAVDLLDRIADVYHLASWALESDRFSTADAVKAGKPLPKELEDAPWGKPEENGVRVAWLLDPKAKQYRINTPLKSRLLYQNSGAKTILLRVNSFNQSAGHQATNQTGERIHINATRWTTIGQISTCRLAPGEYVEVMGAGIGIGEKTDQEIWRNTRVGAWIHATAGDSVVFQSAPISLSGNDGRKQELSAATWWKEFVVNHLRRYTPVPSSAEERRLILQRAIQHLYATKPTYDEIQEFASDKGSEAQILDNLATRLANRDRCVAIAGELNAGSTSFKVLPVDPEASERAFLAVGPGKYKIGQDTWMQIIGRGKNPMESTLQLRSNSNQILHELELPKGFISWAIAWKRDRNFFWIVETGGFRKVDFSDTDALNVTEFTLQETESIPPPYLEALKSMTERLNAPPASPADQKRD